MDTLISLCKQRGFIYQSSEIYNGLAGFFDYGPLGVEVKNNIKSLWWREHVHCRDDVVGIDCSIISSPSIWDASGHTKGFSDPMVECKESKLRYRADHLFYAKVFSKSNNEKELGYISVTSGETMIQEANKQAQLLASKNNIRSKDVVPITENDLIAVSDIPLDMQTTIIPLIPSPSTGKIGNLSVPRDFNLMFQTQIGAVTNSASVAYLRPETAQGIFTNYLNVQRSQRMKVSIDAFIIMLLSFYAPIK
jgi:glycyl-tRNA synthetase